MRGSVIASTSVHLALVAALFLVRTPHTMIVPGPDVVQVSLLDSPQLPAITPVAPQPVKAPEPERIAPTEDSGVKLEKPKPAKKTAPREEEAPPLATPAPALPYASVGAAGLQGAIALDSNFEFTYYLTLVRNRIAQSWAPPAGLSPGGQPVRSVMYFRIARDGSITSIRIETGSGVEYFDRSALRAIQLSDPLPPLPLGYSGGDLGVHFGFQYQAP